ncbi:MAG: hypothetical protein ACN6O7_04280 [Sphingobacterium sp.]
MNGYRILGIAFISFAIISCGKNDLSQDNLGTGEEGKNGTSPGPAPENKIPELSIWHWGSEKRPYGINNVIMDEARMSETIDSYIQNKVTRVYGGYSKIPAHPIQKENLAKWNRKLKHLGIKSIYLIGNEQWIYPENRQMMIDYILEYYVKFNLSVDVDAKLQGLHLDLEPHQLKEWSAASMHRKRELLYLLKDTYRDLRLTLRHYGMEKDELMADIPTWFDEMSAIGWASEIEKYNWFSDTMNYINGFTIMAYELASIPTIVQRTNWERNNFKANIQIGLDADEIGRIWNSKSAIINALREINVQTQAPIAVHNYTTFMEQ